MALELFQMLASPGSGAAGQDNSWQLLLACALAAAVTLAVCSVLRQLFRLVANLLALAVWCLSSISALCSGGLRVTGWLCQATWWALGAAARLGAWCLRPARASAEPLLGSGNLAVQGQAGASLAPC